MFTKHEHGETVFTRPAIPVNSGWVRTATRWVITTQSPFIRLFREALLRNDRERVER